MTTTLTPDQRAEFLRRFPTTPNAVLCADYGITPHAARQIGARAGLRKTAECLKRGQQDAQRRGAQLLPPDRIAEMMQLYPTTSNAHLACMFGVRTDYCRKLARRYGAEKTAEYLHAASVRGANMPRAKRVKPEPAPVAEPKPAYHGRPAGPRGLPFVRPGEDIPRYFSLVPVGVNPATGQAWGQV